MLLAEMLTSYVANLPSLKPLFSRMICGAGRTSQEEGRLNQATAPTKSSGFTSTVRNRTFAPFRGTQRTSHSDEDILVHWNDGKEHKPNSVLDRAQQNRQRPLELDSLHRHTGITVRRDFDVVSDAANDTNAF